MDLESLKKNHSLHGALAGVVVYAITGKPVPALVVGGGLYAYMSVYGHALPGSSAQEALPAAVYSAVAPPRIVLPQARAPPTIWRPLPDYTPVAMGHTPMYATM